MNRRKFATGSPALSAGPAWAVCGPLTRIVFPFADDTAFWQPIVKATGYKIAN